jgi:hypothetical protein
MNPIAAAAIIMPTGWAKSMYCATPAPTAAEAAATKEAQLEYVKAANRDL